MESQPQNPEFRNNPENFHPCILLPLVAMILARYDQELMVSGLGPVQVLLVVSFSLFSCLPY